MHKIFNKMPLRQTNVSAQLEHIYTVPCSVISLSRVRERDETKNKCTPHQRYFLCEPITCCAGAGGG